MGVFDNAVELDWLVVGETMLAIDGDMLAYVRSTGPSDDDEVEVRHIPVARIVGIDLTLDNQWVKNRWFDMEPLGVERRTLGTATLHLDYPSLEAIELPMQTGNSDDQTVRFLTSLQHRIAGRAP